MIKKLEKLTIIFVICIGTMLSCFLPCTKFVPIAKASDNQSQIHQTLINPNMSDSDWTNIYGGKSGETSNFTPFNYESKSRLSGKSVVPEPNDMDEYRRFENLTYKLLENGGLSSDMTLSFGIWLYFSDVSVHGLSIKLVIDDDNYAIIELTKQQVIDYMKKTEVLNEQAFAWNYLEIPLKSFMVVGNIYENDVLKKFNNITFTYTSEVVESQNTNFAGFRFYGAYLHESTVNQITATEKQDYTIYSFNFWGEEITQNSVNNEYTTTLMLQNLIKGDFVNSQILKNAINYAWVGELNLLTQNNLISWQIIVTTPGGTNENYNFGEQIRFLENGCYTISYKAESTNDNLVINLYHSIYVYVRSDKLIYFDFSNYNIDVDEKQSIKLNFDEIIDMNSVEIIEVSVGDNDKLKLTQVDNNTYSIEGLKDGETSVTIKINAKRNNNSEIKQYTASTNIIINKSANTNNIIIPIVIVLSVILIIGVAVGIRNIIISRRNDVK